MGLLHVRRTLNRLNKKERPTTLGEATTEIVIHAPKSENSIRGIPLLPSVAQDLLSWKSVQANDRISAGEQYCDSGMLVTNQFEGYIEPRTFKDYYNQILELGGMRHFTFHALRHTFASRAMSKEWIQKRFQLSWDIIQSRLPLIPTHTFLSTTRERAW